MCVRVGTFVLARGGEVESGHKDHERCVVIVITIEFNWMSSK